MKTLKALFLAAAIMIVSTIGVKAQDYNGLLKAATTFTNAQTDSIIVSIPLSRSAISFKTQITKTSGTVAGTITLQYKLTNLASEQWTTYNTYTITDASQISDVRLLHNPAIKWKILTVTSGTSVSVHRNFLLYRK